MKYLFIITYLSIVFGFIYIIKNPVFIGLYN